MTNEELKPCPFCGGEASIYKFAGIKSRTIYWAECKSCEVDCKEYLTEQEAIKAWNTRAEPQAVDVEALKMDEEKIFENLCAHDERSPHYYYDEEIDDEKPVARRDDCSCDNCFYGRDKLALEILRLKKDTRAEPQSKDVKRILNFIHQAKQNPDQSRIGLDFLEDVERVLSTTSLQQDNAEALAALDEMKNSILAAMLAIEVEKADANTWNNLEKAAEGYETIRAALEGKNNA